MGLYGKIRIFGPKSKFSGPDKKSPLLGSNHVLVTTGKRCANKKVPFSKKNISRFRSGVIVGNFLMAWTVQPSFVEDSPKLRIIIILK